MLIAAMILGLVGGILYFVGGATGVIVDAWEEAASWWAIALIPIGLIGFIGGALARTRADLAAIFMLLAGLSALVVGLYSAQDAFGGSGLGAGYLSVHPLMSSSPFFIPPLVLLIVGGALALTAKRRLIRGRHLKRFPFLP